MTFGPLYDNEKNMVASVYVREEEKEIEREIPKCEVCGNLVSTNPEDYWISKETCERSCCTYSAEIAIKSHLFDKGEVVCKSCQEDEEKNKKRKFEYVKKEVESEISFNKRKIKKQKKRIEREKEKLKELEKDLETIEKIEKEIENKIIKENKKKDVFFIGDNKEKVNSLKKDMEDHEFLRELKYEPVEYKYIGSRILVD